MHLDLAMNAPAGVNIIDANDFKVLVKAFFFFIVPAIFFLG